MRADETGAPASGLRVVAIDGPAGSGKSTVARELARRLGLDYLDTGAMYRSVAFAALQRGVDPEDRDPVGRLAAHLSIEVGERVLVDGYDATIEIRGPEVTRAVSAVAANPEVRTAMRERQRTWGRDHGGGVIEGRDIGTVVFPDATLKVYLTADDRERARRRHKEATELSYDADSPGLAVESVHADLRRRDHLDSTRSTSPLTLADDAVTVDTTGRTVDEIVEDLMGRLAGAGGDRPPLAPVSPVPAASPVPPASRAVEAPGGSGRATRDSHGVWRPGERGRWARELDLALYRSCRGALAVFCRLFWRLSIDGTENLPATGAYVVAPVHRSNIDTPLVGCLTRRRLRFMGKDSMWTNRASARFFTALGGFPVHRGSADRDALRRCIEVITEGEPLVVYPEGGRQSGPIVAELFEGAAYIATRTGVPIVPVGIGGSERAMPKGARGLRPVRIAMVVGHPLEPQPVVGAARRGSRRAVKELTERLRKELQDLFDTAQVKAGA